MRRGLVIVDKWRLCRDLGNQRYELGGLPGRSQGLRRIGGSNPIGPFETTQGVLRACFPHPEKPAPFMFVSGIANRVGQFAKEVLPAQYQQNFVAAYNAGAAVAQMLPALMAVLAAP